MGLSYYYPGKRQKWRKILHRDEIAQWPVTRHSDLDRTSKLAVDRNYLAHGNTLLDRGRGKERETLRSIDGGATYGFVPDSAHFCFVAVFRPASVQTPHTEIHTAPRPFFPPSRCVLPRGSERDVRASAYFHPRIERVTKHPSLSRRNPFCHRSPAVFQIPNLASRLSKLETLRDILRSPTV